MSVCTLARAAMGLLEEPWWDVPASPSAPIPDTTATRLLASHKSSYKGFIRKYKLFWVYEDFLSECDFANLTVLEICCVKQYRVCSLHSKLVLRLKSKVTAFLFHSSQ